MHMWVWILHTYAYIFCSLSKYKMYTNLLFHQLWFLANIGNAIDILKKEKEKNNKIILFCCCLYNDIIETMKILRRQNLNGKYRIYVYPEFCPSLS